MTDFTAATFPPSCKHLSAEYKCSGKDNTFVEPSDMKPFTDYSCTGLIKNNDVSINKTTPPVHFNIDCDFTIKDLMTSRTTNTSIELSWETTSKKCQDILHKLEKLSYSCSCQDAERTATEETATTQDKTSRKTGGTCHVENLKTFEPYVCKVHPIYDDKNNFKGTNVTAWTDPGYYHTVGSAVLISHFHLLLIIIVIVQNVTFICRGRASRRNKPPPKHLDKETH
ncbi:uncharacterized protein LOC118564126 [Fundulus heteroclitus]|uniref:uncharacterized protein LOC118564126 n=1 Tax=Fundulus heteroclitus TaxID=8078 RepID=UPI00165C1347|nr:uncharacterized protein LOC118564126 [Fundulus heteroclitus]